MMLFQKHPCLGLLFLLPWSGVHAYGRVIQSDSQSPAPSTQTMPSGVNRKPDAGPAVVAKKKVPGYTHMVNTSLALRRLDVDDFSFGSFNSQPIQNINEKAINDISFDYGFSYHYRPAAPYSIGFAFDRLQVNQQSLDLRYSSTDVVQPDPTTLAVIASDLTASDDPYAIANYYSPISFGNRGFAYEAVVRAYIIPKSILDPFFQVTIGYTHNRGSVHREDGSVYIYSTDEPWTWSIGSGFSYPLSSSMRLEFLGMVRNQDKMQVSDSIYAPSQSAQYSFIGIADRYYSADLKISLCQTW